MTSVKGYLAIVSALVFCPCHLPILAAVLAGTTLGGAINEYFGLIFPLTAVYFVAALFLGVRWMTRTGEASDCSTCVTPQPAAEAEQSDAARPAEARDRRTESGQEEGQLAVPSRGRNGSIR